MEVSTQRKMGPPSGLPRRLAKRAYHKVLDVPGLASAFRHVQGDYATVFMFHRFDGGDSQGSGLDPTSLTRGLEYLRKAGFELVSLEDLFRRLAGEGSRLRGAVAFTIDDGYLDQAEIAAPIFRRFDCPVTTFVTTGFVDGALWMWWDKIEYVFLHTQRTSLAVELGGQALRYELTGPPHSLATMSADFAERCKAVNDEERECGIARLAQAAEVELPERAPCRYSAMTWDDVRACEQLGMQFGPHTVTHPILSRTTSERSEHELSESWRRLQAEARSPVPIFCYPNGRRGASVDDVDGDFSEREIASLRSLGLRGAVCSEAGFAVPRLFRSGPDEPFAVPRLAYPEDRPSLAEYAGGIERLKQALRSA